MSNLKAMSAVRPGNERISKTMQALLSKAHNSNLGLSTDIDRRICGIRAPYRANQPI
jgi:hypothetical protein